MNQPRDYHGRWVKKPSRWDSKQLEELRRQLQSETNRYIDGEFKKLKDGIYAKSGNVGKSMQLKASEEFIVGKYKIGWVSDSFKEHFYDLTFGMGTPTVALQSRTLKRNMTDAEIFKELSPEPVSLGDVLWFLDHEKQLGWNIFYVENAKGVRWVVHAHRSRDDGSWNLYADPVHPSHEWNAGRRLLSRRFSDTQPSAQTLKPSESQFLTINGVKYQRVKE